MATSTQAPTPSQLAAFRATGDKLKKLASEMMTIFPEREHLVMQIIYALMTGEHVLIYGPKGTGKSDLVTSIFEVFDGAKRFSVSLSKFMTESAVIGIPNPKKMQEEGVLEYNIEDSIVTCNFAELDEMLDANSPLLRVLLTILNERHFKRGRQSVNALLHTAIASTNLSPEEAMQRDGGLEAVIDRFLFSTEVGYLEDSLSRLRMYAKYLQGGKPTVRISYEELQSFYFVVRDANQIDDPELLAVYDEVLEAAQAAVGRTVSDRTACKFLKLVEANALMNGRYGAELDDILAIKYALCVGGSPEEVERFDETATPIIEKAKASLQQNVDELQNTAIKKIRREIPTLPPNAGARALVAALRKLRELQAELSAVKPTLTSTQLAHKQLEEDLGLRAEEVQRLIDGR